MIPYDPICSFLLLYLYPLLIPWPLLIPLSFSFTYNFVLYLSLSLLLILSFPLVAGLADPSTGVLFTHVDDRSLPGNTALSDLLISVSRDFINETYETDFVQPAYEPLNNRLPPSSLMSFLKERSDISGVVLSDFKSVYSNPYERKKESERKRTESKGKKSKKRKVK